MIKERLKNILTKIKNNKKKVIGVTAIVFAAFIFTFTVYNLNNPTKINRLFANVLNNGKPVNDAFEDNTFYSCVIDAYNSDHQDNKKAYTDNLTDEELASVTSLMCEGWRYSDSDKITSAKGVEKLTGLTTLDLYGNKLTNIDLSQNTLLTNLSLYSNQLASIDLSQNTSLTDLDLSANQLTSIDLSQNTALTELDLSENKLTNIDLSQNTSLTGLSLSETLLVSLDLTKNIALTGLELYYVELTNIDLSQNTNLTELGLAASQLVNIALSRNTTLTYLGLGSNQLASIDLSQNTALEELELQCDQLTSIDLTKNIALTDLELYDSQLTNLDLSKNTELESLSLSGNQLLTSLDLSKNTGLESLSLRDNQLTSIDLSNNSSLRYLEIDDTLLKEDILMQVGETYNVEEKIIPPEGQNFTYSIDDTSIATIEGNVITAKSDGNTTLRASFGNVSFNRKIFVGSIKLSTDRNPSIKIDNDKKFIYFEEFDRLMYENDETELSDDVKVNYGKLKINGNMLQVVSGSKVLDEYKIVYIDSSIRMDDGYLLVKASVNDLDPIKCINCTYELSNDGKEISIKYDDEEIDKKKIMYMFLPDNGMSSLDSTVLIFGDKMYDKNDIKEISNIKEIEKDKINFLNAKVELEKFEYNNILKLYFDDHKIDLHIVFANFFSNNYDLTKDYIYLGTNDFKNDIQYTFGEEKKNVNELEEIDAFNRTDKSFEIWLTDRYCDDDDECSVRQIKRLGIWNLIKVSSDKYDMNGDIINLGNEDIDLTKINVTNATLKKEDNKLLVMYGDEVVKEFKLEGGKKTTTTTKKDDEKTTTTKITTTKEEVKTTTTKKKESIIDKIFGNKETTTKKEETTTKKNIFRKSTTTKVENSSGNVTSNNKNSFKKLVTGSNLLISLLSITGIALIMYIIVDKKKNKFNN